ENDVGFAYGSLACGADILFAEAMLARGGDYNVVLPFRTDEFIDISVRPGGEHWVGRFQNCLDKAASVHFATEDSYLGDDHLFAYATRLAMGLALLRARYLDAPVRQIAVWDGRPAAANAAAGTAVDIDMWRGFGFDQLIIDSPASDGASPPTITPDAAQSVGRVNRALLFGDVKGFSRLDDRQLPLFVDEVLGAMAATLNNYGDDILFRNTWGDGIYLVFADVSQAARCALNLQIAMAGLPLEQLGLPDHIGLRLGGHFGPVYESLDPIVGGVNFFGAHVSRAARIEPITPEGCVYVSEPFAAAIALDPTREFTCDYVGTTPMAKGYGDLPMYLLRRRAD
ncbi:MAG: adenylate/guanylate cyclase domain-containing protein, partial [Rhodospirillaceae bacterium]|nr:adenylate/guanylate cyclase domain-containing protein [Rhodospirillaceae bacterium]